MNLLQIWKENERCVLFWSVRAAGLDILLSYDAGAKMVARCGSLVYLDNCKGASRACYRVDVSDCASEGYDGIFYWRWDGVVTRWRRVCFSLWNACEALLVLMFRYLVVLNWCRGIFGSIHGWCRKQKGNYRELFMRRNSVVFEHIIIRERAEN